MSDTSNNNLYQSTATAALRNNSGSGSKFKLHRIDSARAHEPEANGDTSKA